jgi:hypothetical protein
MGRVKQYISIDGRKAWTLLPRSKLNPPYRTGLGGGVKVADEAAILDATIEGHKISTHAMVVDEIGKDEDGKPIEVLFGALAMQQWGIRPLPDQEALDLSRYTTDFVEF